MPKNHDLPELIEETPNVAYLFKLKASRNNMLDDEKKIKGKYVLMPDCIGQRKVADIRYPINAFAASIQKIISLGGIPIIIAADKLQRHTLKIKGDYHGNSKLNNLNSLPQLIDNIGNLTHAWKKRLADVLAEYDIDLDKDCLLYSWDDYLAAPSYSNAENFIKEYFGSEIYSAILAASQRMASGETNDISPFLRNNILTREIEEVWKNGDNSKIDNTFRRDVLLSAKYHLKRHFKKEEPTLSDWIHALTYVLEESTVFQQWLSTKDEKGKLKYPIVFYTNSLNSAMYHLIHLHNGKQETIANDDLFIHAYYSIQEKIAPAEDEIVMPKRNSNRRSSLTTFGYMPNNTQQIKSAEIPKKGNQKVDTPEQLEPNSPTINPDFVEEFKEALGKFLLQTHCVLEFLEESPTSKQAVISRQLATHVKVTKRAIDSLAGALLKTEELKQASTLPRPGV